MVNVVITDVAGKPLQHAWQAIIGTSFQRRLMEIPRLVGLPIGVFVLMLNEKEPTPYGSRNHHDGHVYQEKGSQSHGPPGQAKDRQNSKIGEVHTPALTAPRARYSVGEPLHNDELESRAQKEHHQWMSLQTIPEASPTRERRVFFDGKDTHVTVSAVVEIAAGDVMPRMRTAPEVIRCDREDSAERSEMLSPLSVAES
jgi:hypothetical protein